MFKIEIRYKGKLHKKKFYETEKQFKKWLFKHSKHHGALQVCGFQLLQNEWYSRTLGD